MVLNNLLKFNGGEYSSRSPKGGANYIYDPTLYHSNLGYGGKGYTGGSSCKVGGAYCGSKLGGSGTKLGGKNMKKSRKYKKNKSLNKSRNYKKNKSLNKSRKYKKNKSLNKSRNYKKNKRYKLKGGNNQPYSNVPMSFSYTLNGGQVNPSALASPPPFTPILNN